METRTDPTGTGIDPLAASLVLGAELITLQAKVEEARVFVEHVHAQ